MAEMKVVRDLDVNRYMGKWCEIASFPSFFQPSNGADTTATYTLNDDGTVHVLNETWSDGKKASIEGTAYKADPKSDEAKLKVKFYVPPFLPIIPVTGNYWVLFVDDNYQFAVVGEPTRKYLWILSREKHVEKGIYNQLVERGKEEGYDVSKLRKTAQSAVIRLQMHPRTTASGGSNPFSGNRNRSGPSCVMHNVKPLVRDVCGVFMFFELN